MNRKRLLKILKYFSLIFILIFFSCASANKHNNVLLRGEPHSDEALIILGGFTATPDELEKATEYFKQNSSYDVLTPDFKSKDGFSACVKNLKQFISGVEITKYRKVHFFCYLLGGMILREFLKQDSISNLGKIVIDRAPLQERLALVVEECYPDFLLRKIWGQTLFDIAAIDYSHYAECGVDIGLLIETRAAKVIRFHIEQILNVDTLSFAPDDIMKGYTDYAYVPMDHDQMYDEIFKFGPMVLNFFKTGSFGETANRTFSGKIEGIRIYHSCVSCGIGTCSGCLFFIP